MWLAFQHFMIVKDSSSVSRAGAAAGRLLLAAATLLSSGRARAGGDGVESAGLAMLLPETGPDGSKREAAIPGDLPDITNSLEVAAADYRDAAGETVATALIVETNGEVYEHSKALCDRAGGARIDLIDAQHSEEGIAVLRAQLRHDAWDKGESALEFKLYEQADGSFEARSAWLQEDYPAPLPGQRVLNVQTWSRRPGYEIALAEAILSAQKVTWTEAGTVPAAHVAEARTLGGVMEAEIAAGSVEPSELSMRVTRLLEDGTTASELLAVKSPHVGLDYPPYLDMTLELLDPEGRAIDRAWLTDGAWTSLDDGLWGGATHVNELVTIGCMTRTRAPAEGDLTLSGCARLRAQVSEVAGVARHFSGGYAPVDLSDHGALEVTLTSNQPVRICIEKPDSEPGEPPCADIAGPLDNERVHLSFSAFSAANKCKAERPKVAASVTFTARRKGYLDLTASDLVFTRAAPRSGSAMLPCGGLDNTLPPLVQAEGCNLCNTGSSHAGTAYGGLLLAAIGLLAGARRRGRRDR
jgi:MYXO-CTERM domain-containing protein